MANKKELYRLKNEQYIKAMHSENGVKELRGGILYKVIEDGTGDKHPTPRSIVTCHYRGSTIDGKVFDETFSSNCPAAFRVNDLISGFQIALVNMHVGDHWIVYIPSELGYGKHGAGSDIPGNSTLIFEIQLITIA